MPDWVMMDKADRIEAIRRGYRESDGTATAIASALSRRFGEAISRNVVVGYYARNAEILSDCPLTGVGGRKPAEGAKTEAGAQRPAIARDEQVSTPPKPLPASSLPPIEAAPVPRMIPLLELDDSVCRWPVTEASENTGFCGHPTGGKPPYCPYHRTKAHGEGTRAEQTALKNLKRITQR